VPRTTLTAQIPDLDRPISNEKPAGWPFFRPVSGLCDSDGMIDHDSAYILLFSYAEMVEKLLRGFVREDCFTAISRCRVGRIRRSAP